MSLEYRYTLYGPIYDTLAVPAVLVMTDGVTTFDQLRCLDKTAGVVLGGPIELQTVVPAAMMIAGELVDAGLAIETDIDGSTIALNGLTWRIADHRNRPSPGGERDGEVMLILETTS